LNMKQQSEAAVRAKHVVQYLCKKTERRVTHPCRDKIEAATMIRIFERDEDKVSVMCYELERCKDERVWKQIAVRTRASALAEVVVNRKPSAFN
jgi:hypothetical protein